MSVTEAQVQAAIEGVMRAAEAVLEDVFGEEVGLVMIVKEQDSVNTSLVSNLDHNSTHKIVHACAMHHPIVEA